jgi:type II secretory pathway pseudopilin PulG
MKKISSGYTLIELLLYISILGSLLTAVSLYFGTAVESRVKNQSIAEVNQQGVLVVERISQAIRNANSITTPTTNVCGTSLNLAMPGGVNPTVFSTTGSSGGTSVLGYNVDGGTTDTGAPNHVNASRFVASASGLVTSLNARVAGLSANPNNRAQMALYSGSNNPTTLLTSSAEISLSANAWNTFCVPPVAITAGQTYWVAYNTNGLGDTNNLRYHTGAANQTRWIIQPYGTWPASYTGTTSAAEFSMYATVYTGTGTGAAAVSEAGGGDVALTNSKVQVSGLTFQNLSRSGTPGIVRVNFVVSRSNPNNRNEYDYQKAFTFSASLR